jgi:hypothetical protein
LSRIEVYLARLSFASDSAVLTVYSTTGGVPNVALGNASVSATQISTTTPTFVSFDLNSFQIPVNANDVLAYSMMSSAGGLYIMPFESTNSYPGGSSYRRTLSVPPGPWQIQTDRDYGFKTYLLIDESAELFGDYNDDHVVNAADYTVWRNMLGTDGPLPHDFTPEVVDDDDYDYWKAHFGESSGGLGSSAAVQVPEPTTLILVGMAFGCRAMPPRTRKRRQNR